MEFIMDYLLPALGTTVIGLTVIILLLLIVVLITILAQIKDYKEIKANLLELKLDLKNNFLGIGNKKRRTKILCLIIAFIISVFLLSAVYLYMQKPKQIVINSPIEKSTINVWDETLITWNPISGTSEYFVSIYPANKGVYNGSELYSFYVSGDKAGVKIIIGNYIYGTGKYNISVSSDAENTEHDTIVVYLDNTSQQTDNVNINEKTP